jgi:hypothetical protein
VQLRMDVILFLRVYSVSSCFVAENRVQLTIGAILLIIIPVLYVRYRYPVLLVVG